MAHILSDIGEEWYTETAVDGSTVTITLYNDSNDSFSETDDLADITEPAGGSYSRQSDTVTVGDISGDWGFDNDAKQTFDTTDSSLTVDSAALIVNFDSDEAGDGGTPADHIIGTAALSQSRDLSSVDEVVVSAGEAGVKVN